MNYRNLVIVILIFFGFFLSSSGLVTYAQYDDFGGYGYYYEDSYGYPSVNYDYSYYYDYDYYVTDTYVTYDTFDYPHYTYPSLPYPGVNNYPVAPYTNYSYPPLPTPPVNDYPVVPYENYVYPPLPTPDVNDYPAMSYGNYSYPPLSYPANYNYPVFSGSYPDLITPSALAAVSGETVAHAQSVSEVPTGPDGILPWILLGGFVLSAFVYLIIFKFRFNLRLRFSGNYSGAVLEKRLKEIRNRELAPDTNDFQI